MASQWCFTFLRHSMEVSVRSRLYTSGQVSIRSNSCPRWLDPSPGRTRTQHLCSIISGPGWPTVGDVKRYNTTAFLFLVCSLVMWWVSPPLKKSVPVRHVGRENTPFVICLSSYLAVSDPAQLIAASEMWASCGRPGISASKQQMAPGVSGSWGLLTGRVVSCK